MLMMKLMPASINHRRQIFVLQKRTMIQHSSQLMPSPLSLQQLQMLLWSKMHDFRNL
jgi:hypothetical protein